MHQALGGTPIKLRQRRTRHEGRGTTLELLSKHVVDLGSDSENFVLTEFSEVRRIASVLCFVAFSCAQ